MIILQQKTSGAVKFDTWNRLSLSFVSVDFHTLDQDEKRDTSAYEFDTAAEAYEALDAIVSLRKFPNRYDRRTFIERLRVVQITRLERPHVSE